MLWNALVLHARWGGMVKERGLAMLAVVGNIVTSWSWFGVNELGVGLHSYGFTEGVLLKPGNLRGHAIGHHRAGLAAEAPVVELPRHAGGLAVDRAALRACRGSDVTLRLLSRCDSSAVNLRLRHGSSPSAACDRGDRQVLDQARPFRAWPALARPSWAPASAPG